LRVKGRDAAYKVFQLANVAVPWVGLEALNGTCLDRLLTKALTRRVGAECEWARR
jgi:predicted ATP-grasp superfamily ATP-dependent carboligase